MYYSLQVSEIKEYLNEIGAHDIDITPTPADWIGDLKLMIPHLKVCFQEKADDRKFSPYFYTLILPSMFRTLIIKLEK